MNREQQHALLSIALLAAFADGSNDERERENVRRLADSLGEASAAPELAGIYQRVLLKQIGVGDAVGVLVAAEHRQLAYEVAVCVCDADGRTTAAERAFLAELAAALDLPPGFTATADQEAEAMADLSLDAAPTRTTAVAAPDPVVAAVARVDAAELDRRILNYAILNGALELLPQSWASMAIIPLQVKLVYGIGKDHGYELDQGHIRELLATLGVGMTSQYLEQFGRKLLGGLLGKIGGGLGGSLGRSATGIAFSFATTYALGQVARAYYAGGRQMSSALLQDSFRKLLGPAKELQSRYLPDIERRAGSLDAGQILAMVRGK